MQFPIVVPRGTDYSTVLQLFDDEGSPYDASGSTIALGVKVCANDDEYVISKVAAWDETIGGCEFHFDPWDTADLPMPNDCTKYLRMFYDICILDASNKLMPIVEMSPFYVAPMVTDFDVFIDDGDWRTKQAAVLFVGFNRDSSATVTIKLKQQRPFDVAVDWGDGTVTHVKQLTATVSHVYQEIDSHDVYRVMILTSHKDTYWIAGAYFADNHILTFDLKNVSGLSENCCKDCVSITSACFPRAVETIPHGTFSGCSRLSTVYLPDTLTSIDDDAFFDCDGLEDIYFAGSQDQWNAIAISDVGNSALQSAAVHYNYDYFND